jgi:hypothetical protein
MKKIILSCMALLAAMSMAAQTEVMPRENNGNGYPQSVTIVVPSNDQPAQNVYNWADYRHNFSFSVGLPGLYSTAMGKHSWDFYINRSTTTTPGGTVPRSELFCGAWAIDYGYQIMRWLRIGAIANYEYWMGDIKTHDAAVLAKVDFTYINKEHLRLYSGVGLGVGVHIEKYADGTVAGRYIPAVIGTPIGLQAGSPKVYALVETNVGSASFLRVGIGFRP